MKTLVLQLAQLRVVIMVAMGSLPPTLTHSHTPSHTSHTSHTLTHFTPLVYWCQSNTTHTHTSLAHASDIHYVDGKADCADITTEQKKYPCNDLNSTAFMTELIRRFVRHASTHGMPVLTVAHSTLCLQG